MLAINALVRPWSARCPPRSVGSLTTSCSPAPSFSTETRSTSMSRWMRSDSSPRGPFTVTRSGSIEIDTPDGSGMGCFPIRDIWLSSLWAGSPQARSPDSGHDLATNAGGAGVVAGHQALGGRDDGGPHSALDPGNVRVVDVRALAGPRGALHAGDHRLALRRVLERHGQLHPRPPIGGGVKLRS